VRRLSLLPRGDGQLPGTVLERPLLDVPHERGSDARSARILKNHERREPGDWILVVDRRENVRCRQADHLAVPVRRYECCRA